eukprot:6165636-Pyramimonas_sp.AAC.1
MEPTWSILGASSAVGRLSWASSSARGPSRRPYWTVFGPSRGPPGAARSALEPSWKRAGAPGPSGE